MASVHVKISSAKGLRNTDTIGKSDPYVHASCSGQVFTTRVIKDNLNPVWEESHTFPVSDPADAVVILTVWDEDRIKNHEFLGSAAVPMNRLRDGEPYAVEIPLLAHRPSEGTINVVLTAQGFTGLAGEVQRLQRVSDELSASVAHLKTVEESLHGEVNQLRGEREKLHEETNRLTDTAKRLEEDGAALRTNITELTSEREKLHETNNQLSDTAKRLEEDGAALRANIADLSAERQRLHEENEKLSGSIKQLGDEIATLHSTVSELREEREKLHETNNQLSATATRLEEDGAALRSNIAELSAEREKLHDVNNELQGTAHRLEQDGAALRLNVEQLTSERQKLHEENQKLSENVAELGGEIATLKTVVADLTTERERLHEENNRLAETEKRLEADVAVFTLRITTMSQQIQKLDKTRELLEESVAKQEEQNDRLSDELGKLRTIEDGLRQFASQSAADYGHFVDQLASNLNRNEQLLKDFASENQKLRVNRRKQRIESMLSLANGFQHWDNKIGLSPHEFDAYMQMLGDEFQQRLREKIGATPDRAFGVLDKDGSGSLSVSELRQLLEQLVEEASTI
eukprot:TRINITY_DN41202_c0_g1_i1.p1 TRINITY_DN41202_c0_g1~~TRINITY_DN41202_c0_g1_i1.p1  ORF type:complete len:585 (-),score=151.77 TRINITY_DN41202_c0_g1_i1:14-1744(-)